MPSSRSLDGVLRRFSWSWPMYLLGLVFDLGFDTATESGLPGQAAAQAVKGLWRG